MEHTSAKESTRAHKGEAVRGGGGCDNRRVQKGQSQATGLKRQGEQSNAGRQQGGRWAAHRTHHKHENKLETEKNTTVWHLATSNTQ